MVVPAFAMTPTARTELANDFRIRNNIVYGNERGIEADALFSPAAGFIGYNDVFENAAGNFLNYPSLYGDLTTMNANGVPADEEMNISEDPLFAMAPFFHLSVVSPCVNAGTSSAAPATDVDGEPRIEPVDIGFDEVDAVAPAIISLSPSDDAIDAPVTGNLEIVFDEDVQVGTGNIVIKRASDDSVVEVIDVNSAAVAIAGSTVTIDPSVTLEEVTGYYVVVDAGAFRDLAGNDFPGISGNTTWNFTTGDFTAPTVTGVQIGNGSAQRSMVNSLAITFSELVTIDAGAFEVIQRGTGTAVDVSFTTEDVGGMTIATLTFSGALTEYGSLVDGNYQLNIRSDRVRDRRSDLDLDGDEDGAAGGDYVFGDEEVDAFFRLFGDADGSRFVGNNDYALFRLAFRKALGEEGYDPLFDSDGSGFIGNNDYALFRLRFRTGLPFE